MINKAGKDRRFKKERIHGRELTEEDFGSQLNRFSMPQFENYNSNSYIDATRENSFYGNNSHS